MAKIEKLAYILDWKFGPNSGVGQKVIDQVTSWNSFGLKTSLIVVCPRNDASAWQEVPEVTAVLPYSNFFSRSFARKRAIRFAENSGANLFYTRFGILTPFFVKKILTMPTILELNFLGLTEHKRRSKFLFLYLIYIRRKAFRRSVGACAVTNEIAAEFLQIVNNKIPCESFPNSIDLSKLPILKTIKNSKPKLVFVGSPHMVAHGVDRIEDLSDVLPEFEFHIIGPNESAIKRNNMIFTGELFGQELYGYLEGMDVAISVLALERNRLSEASPLKTRLYLGLGLPVIAGYRDTSFSQNSEFFCTISAEKLPSDQVTLLKIRDFVSFWSNKRVGRHLVESIDSSVLEKSRVNFLTNI